MYYIFMLLSVITVLSMSSIGLYRKGMELRHIAVLLLSLTLSFFIGARLLNFVVNNPLYISGQHVLFSLKPLGFSLYGGIILCAIMFLILQKIFSWDLWSTLDVLIPSLGIGIIIIRIGCFLNGCCFGKITSLPWGITYPALSNAHKYQINKYGAMAILFPQPVHPTQIYEIIGVSCALLFGYSINKKYSFTGAFSLAFVTIFSLSRLINHFLRAEIYDPFISNFFYPFVYMFIILIASTILFKKILKH